MGATESGEDWQWTLAGRDGRRAWSSGVFREYVGKEVPRLLRFSIAQRSEPTEKQVSFLLCASLAGHSL